jgi:hypothetical protein
MIGRRDDVQQRNVNWNRPHPLIGAKGLPPSADWLTKDRPQQVIGSLRTAPSR